jgi:4-aminobutyrate aminotransferase
MLPCRSKELFAALNELKTDSATRDTILDVRGSGLMVAVEFSSPSGTSKFDTFAKPGVPAGMASKVAKKCIDNGMLILTTSVYEVIRFIPALNISKEDLAKGIKIFSDAVKEVAQEG